MNFDFFFINKLLTIIINLVGIWLAFWIYFADRKKALNRGFIFFVIINIAWIDFYNLAFLMNQYHLRLLFTRLLYSFVNIWFIFFYYLFIIWFLKEKGWYVLLGKLIIICEAIFFLFVTFTDLVIIGVKLGKWNIIPIYSTVGALIYHLIVVALTIFVTGRLIVRYFEFPKDEKLKIQYLLLGVIIFVTGNLTFAVFLPFFFGITDYLSLSHYSTLFLLAFTAYAIVKQNLFNIKAVLTAFFVGAMAILLGVDIVAFTSTTPLRILKTVILFGFLWFGYLLIRNVKREMERREVLERLTVQLQAKTQDLSALLDVSKIIATKETNTKKMSQEALDIIPQKLKHLGFLSGWISLYDSEKNDLYAYAINQNFLGKAVIALLNKLGTPFESYRASLSYNILMAQSFLKQEVFIGEKLSSVISPPVKKTTADKLQKLIGANSCIVVPITAHDKRMGVLGFTMKPKVSEIDDRVKNLAWAFTNHLAVTLENSRYLEKIEAKTQDLQSLLDIAKVATLSLKTKEVTQKILNSIPQQLKHLGYIGGLLTIRNDKENILQTYAVTQTPLIQKALDILNKPFEKYSTHLNRQDPLLLKTLRDGKIYSSDKIEDFISSPVPKNIAQATQKIIGMKTGVGVPITIHGAVEGVIMFAVKRKAEEIDQRDEEIMTAFANHLSLTIENSRLFEETIQKGKQLQKANKNLAELAEAKANFLAIASHQLRTPVSIAKGMLSMLVEGDVPKEKEHEFIERSFVSLQRLNNIIHDLLSAGAVEGIDFKLNKKMAQINNIIIKVVEERAEKAKTKNLELIYNQPQTPLPTFRIDDNKMTEVIANLLDNAIQYTQKGKIEITTKVENKYFVFKIKDTGIGIKKEDFPKLFKKISRLPNAISVRPDGTGLGLYLVKKIIKAHNGKVDVKSNGVNGEGSEFRFWLPMG